nr:hypothetical protein CFP56_12218 [Quercus suber]
MHFLCVTSVLVALIALTAAAPHRIGHAHLHGGSHKFTMIAGRSVLDGACGGASGDMCQPGYCCSQYGYCGKSDEYCSAGCNSAFGTCNTMSSSPETGSVQSSASATTVVIQSTVSVSALPISTSASNSPSESEQSPTESTSTDSSTAAEATKFHPRPTWTTEFSSPPVVTSVAETSAPPAISTDAPSTSAWAPKSVAAPTSEPPAATMHSSAASSATGSTSSGGGAGSDSYKTYTGDGTTSAGWPSEDAWANFDSMWSANLKVISISCTQFGQENNSDDESNDLKSAIQSIASSSGIDERFILAVVMQESKGCVRAPTTNYGVRNPGLMQDHDGTGTCNDATSSNPCPQSAIQQMIKDGVTGTAAGDGLEQCIAESHASDVSKYYKAARIYNSGSVTDNNLSLGVATHCYASDIANRLTGWVSAATSCTL